MHVVQLWRLDTDFCVDLSLIGLTSTKMIFPSNILLNQFMQAFLEWLVDGQHWEHGELNENSASIARRQ